MTITTTKLTWAAAVAAVAAGALFVGVQINHPPLDVSTITTTEVVVRNTLKVAMAVLGLAGISGLYLSQVRRNGVVGLIGYLLLAAAYLTIAATSLVAAFVLPAVAGSDPVFVQAALAAGKGGAPTPEAGALGVVFQVQGLLYLAGGTVLGVALFRARVLARWATALLAVGGLVSVALSVMPDGFQRLLAFPNGIAMIALGVSLWVTTRRAVSTPAPGETTPVGAR